MADAIPVLVFVRDLMFSGRIVAEARASDIPVKVVRDAARLLDEPGTRLVVDLNQDGAIDAAAQWKARHGGHVIGFVSHVDTETIATARDRGIDQILSRGQFVQVVGELLRGG
jgi:predicted nucleic acid-binding protein